MNCPRCNRPVRQVELGSRRTALVDPEPSEEGTLFISESGIGYPTGPVEIEVEADQEGWPKYPAALVPLYVNHSRTCGKE